MRIPSRDAFKLLAWSWDPPTRHPSERWDPFPFKLVRSLVAYVYILASRKNGTLYIGVTRDLIRRIYEHKSGTVEGFTKKYKVDQLVWFDNSESIIAAIQREKQLKNWKRAWKIQLIEQTNPHWHDLYPALLS
jgi:putative endonuclease